MRLYKLTNPYRRGWAAAIVAAESEAHARSFHPNSENDCLLDGDPRRIRWCPALGRWQDGVGGGPAEDWWPRPDEVLVMDLGESDPHVAAGVYLGDIFPYYPEPGGEGVLPVWRGARTPDPDEEAARQAEMRELLARLGIQPQAA